MTIGPSPSVGKMMQGAWLFPGAERGERQKLRDPEPSAPRAAGRRWMCVPLSHDAYSDFISVCLQLCQDTSYSVCCIK